MAARDDAAPVPEWLASALRAVAADFEGPESPPLGMSFRWEPADPSDEDVERHGLLGTIWTGGAGWSLHAHDESSDEGAGREFLKLTLAQWLQDQVVLEAGLVRPACPGHPHPAEYHFRDDQAWWHCPETGRLLFRIGRGEGPGSCGGCESARG